MQEREELVTIFTIYHSYHIPNMPDIFTHVLMLFPSPEMNYQPPSVLLANSYFLSFKVLLKYNIP